MDRPHRGPAGSALAGGALVTTDLRAVTAPPGTVTITGPRDPVKSFGPAPALRGAVLELTAEENGRVGTLSGARP